MFAELPKELRVGWKYCFILQTSKCRKHSKYHMKMGFYNVHSRQQNRDKDIVAKIICEVRWIQAQQKAREDGCEKKVRW